MDSRLRGNDGGLRALLLALLFASPAHAGMCDQPGELYAAELVDAALLSSNLHTVRPCAEVRGHLARFTLDTPYGAIVADSVEMLAVRVEEMHAIEALDERTLAGTAARAAAAGGEDAAKGIARIASNPVDTLVGAPEGAWRFFQRRVAKYGDRASRLGQRVADEAFDRGEAYDAIAARPGVTPARGEPSPPWWRKAGREVARYARGEIGYGRARRTWSRRFGVDPYTSNPWLDARLDRLAWAAVAGEQATKLALGAVSGPAATVLSTSSRLNGWVWELAPDALAERNAQRLAALRCGELEARRFVRDGRFSPAQQTALVDALVELAPASGCDDVLELATALRGEIEARWLVAALRMAHAETGGARVRLGLVGTSVVVRSDDRVLLPLPADWLQWTPATAGFFDAREWRVADKTVLIAGQASPIARRGLARRGFSVVERQPFAGAPPFRRDGYGAL
jgi:hypothetical protein